ncbi:MAG: dTMP kinase [Heliobacteriaceae bacterium]|nr:dTMP kinase [Heliobacteriaceae bacterium]
MTDKDKWTYLKYSELKRLAGLFITLEGADGAGKTTQAALLGRAFTQGGHRVLMTREPGGTPVSEAARRVLLAPSLTGMTPWAEVFLYAAARAQLVGEVIRPALAAGQVVICDRYTDSTLAYQGFGRGLDLEDLRQVNFLATGGLTPHLTLVLNLGVEAGFARVSRRRDTDRLEREEQTFHQRVYQGFLTLATAEPERIQVVPAQGDIWMVHRRLVTAIHRLVPDLPVCRNLAGEDSSC